MFMSAPSPPLEPGPKLEPGPEPIPPFVSLHTTAQSRSNGSSSFSSSIGPALDPDADSSPPPPSFSRKLK